MSNQCINDKAQIVIGSKAEFSIFLVDEQGRPVSLSPWVSGKLVFCNCNNVRTEITLTIPGPNPDKGEIPVVITSVQTAEADEKWVSADVELVDGGAELTVVVLLNKFEIIERACP